MTGAAGFIGRHVVNACVRAGHDVTALDLRPATPELASSVRWVRTDCNSKHLLAEVARGHYSAVLHQAAISDTRVPDGARLHEVNTLTPLRIAFACRMGGARFVYASSHAVYGRLHRHEPIPESADDDRSRCSGPLNPYARSKLALDRQMRALHVSGLRWVGLRYTNVVGADELDKGPTASILSQLLRDAATTGHVHVFSDTLTAARDYVPVEVVASTVELLATTRIPAGVYNLGAGYAVSFAQVLEWCASLRHGTGQNRLDVRLIPNTFAAAYQYYTCADMTALNHALPERQRVGAHDVESCATHLFDLFHHKMTTGLDRP